MQVGCWKKYVLRQPCRNPKYLPPVSRSKLPPVRHALCAARFADDLRSDPVAIHKNPPNRDGSRDVPLTAICLKIVRDLLFGDRGLSLKNQFAFDDGTERVIALSPKARFLFQRRSWCGFHQQQLGDHDLLQVAVQAIAVVLAELFHSAKNFVAEYDRVVDFELAVQIFHVGATDAAHLDFD